MGRGKKTKCNDSRQFDKKTQKKEELEFEDAGDENTMETLTKNRSKRTFVQMENKRMEESDEPQIKKTRKSRRVTEQSDCSEVINDVVEKAAPVAQKASANRKEQINGSISGEKQNGNISVNVGIEDPLLEAKDKPKKKSIKKTTEKKEKAGSKMIVGDDAVNGKLSKEDGEGNGIKKKHSKNSKKKKAKAEVSTVLVYAGYA